MIGVYVFFGLILAMGLLVGLIVGVAGAPEFEDGEISRAALRKLGLSRLSAWDASPANLRAYRERLASLRRWANSLPDPKWRRAYRGWLDYYARSADEAEREYASRQRVATLAQSAPKPPV